MITGNKGEWSEIYTFLKLLADGRIYAGDAQLNVINDVYYPILKILRSETEGDNMEYVIAENDVLVIDSNTGIIETKAHISDFKNQAMHLLEEIQNNTKTFSVPETENFMSDIKVYKLKAKSSDKKDIKLLVHDLITGFTPTLGFSIKSRLGSASTLMNAGNTTNFTYKITGPINDTNIEDINNISTGSKIKDRLKAIEKLGCGLVYREMVNKTFNLNLQLIDSALPFIISEMLIYYFKGLGSTVAELAGILEQKNPCRFETQFNHPFYKYKIKNFLTDIALGMMPGTVWHGKYDATGGYIVIKEDGDIVCYHIYNRNEFQNYLFTNTKLESASSSRYKYGVLYREGNEVFIKLNLQIRFK